MQSGILSTKAFVDYAATNPFPYDRRNWTGYTKVRRQVMWSVPEESGWYAWLFISADITQVIYIGKGENTGRWNIRRRLDDELKNERVAFWNTSHWNPQPTGREVLKKGTSHIAWVMIKEVTPEAVLEVERSLIEEFSPSANIQRDAPRGAHPELARQVIARFVSEITQEQQRLRGLDVLS